MGSSSKRKPMKKPASKSISIKNNIHKSIEKTTSIPHFHQSIDAQVCSLNNKNSQDEEAEEVAEEREEPGHAHALNASGVLTLEEVLERRCRKMRQLMDFYRSYYWGLMEEVRFKYREYYWKFGKGGLEEEREREGLEGSTGEEREREGFLGKKGEERCGFLGCKAKRMAMAGFCYTHILSDSRQQLYKACSYVVKSVQTGPIVCGKPVLKAVVPSLCGIHYEKAEKHIARSLKKAGLNHMPSSNRPAPKFHILITEYVRHIQAKREACNVNCNKNGKNGPETLTVVKDESAN
ncbi:hypothetical protein AMTRI_Chr06g201610 [Amborella trichopoda]|uniref:KAT8 regulatory NSL complex subunit 2 n=1 Tax=Amborella trichopoda TaxID=13333 RepID=U5DHV3_AMBTC|nr:INO80 complex subunit D [Amborella trichopoda]ERN20118.1 hypothetical protein AMTR_s00066p00059340 [Amborella trichopoda]|eukprot:XP_006858651.1 INO80 complex subunit D [Amborella trichopoda]